MGKQILFLTLVLFVFKIQSQSTSFYAERYDTANFTFWSDGYDKFNPSEFDAFIRPTTVNLFTSLDAYDQSKLTVFDFPGTIDISSNPLISIELLQPKNYTYTVYFEAVDLDGNKAKTEEILLPFGRNLEVYTMDFFENDSIDFTQIDKIILTKDRTLTGLRPYVRGDLDFGYYPLVDFYIGAISIGKAIDPLVKSAVDKVVLNKNNWSLDSTIINGSKKMEVISGNLILTDTGNANYLGNYKPFLGFTYKLDEPINLMNHPFLSVKFKTNQNVKVNLDARDLDQTFNTGLGNLEKWNFNYQYSNNPPIDALIPYQQIIAKDCFQVYNIDLNVDGWSLRDSWDIHFIDSIRAISFYVGDYDTTKPLVIEIEEIVVGDVMENGSKILSSDIDQNFSGGFSGIDYSFGLSSAFINSVENEYESVKIHLSKDKNLGDADTLIYDDLISGGTIVSGHIFSFETSDAGNIERFFTLGDFYDFGYTYFDASAYMIYEFEDNCGNKEYVSKLFSFDLVTAVEKRETSDLFFQNLLNSNRLDISTKSDFQFTLYDLQGVELYQSNLQKGENSLILPELPNGMYLLMFENSAGSFVDKLYLNK